MVCVLFGEPLLTVLRFRNLLSCDWFQHRNATGFERSQLCGTWIATQFGISEACVRKMKNYIFFPQNVSQKIYQQNASTKKFRWSKSEGYNKCFLKVSEDYEM